VIAVLPAKNKFLLPALALKQLILMFCTPEKEWSKCVKLLVICLEKIASPVLVILQ